MPKHKPTIVDLIPSKKRNSLPRGPYKDLTGQRFDLLLVLRTFRENKMTYVECQCDCGAISQQVASELLKKRFIASCGCYYVQEQLKSYAPYQGQRFDMLLITRLFYENNRGKIQAECICDCGGIWIGNLNQIQSGKAKSCGCAQYARRKRDYTGERYAKLVVLKTTWETSDGKARVEALCDCGNFWFGRAWSLTSGHTTSCGHCLPPKPKPVARIPKILIPNQHLLSREVARQLYVEEWKKQNREKIRQYSMLGHLRRQARLLGLRDDITREEISFAYQYWRYACAVCGRENGLWETISLDHWIPIASKTQVCPGSTAANLIPLCFKKHDAPPGLDASCNNEKLNQDPVVWLTKKLGKRKATAKLKEIETYFTAVAARSMPCIAS